MNNVDISIRKGDNFTTDILIGQNITDYDITGQVRQTYDSMIGYDFAITVNDLITGDITIALYAPQSSVMKLRDHVYDIQAKHKTDSNLAFTVQGGTVTVFPEVTKDTSVVPNDVTYASDIFVSKTNADIVTLIAGQPVSLDMSGNIVKSTTANANRFLGFVMGDISVGASGGVKTEGIVTASSPNWALVVDTGILTIGSEYYITTDGRLSIIPPASGWSRKVCMAVSSTQIDVRTSVAVNLG